MPQVNKKRTFDALNEERGIKTAERLAYIDFFLQFRGGLSRNDLTSFFGLKEAASSQIIAEYRDLRPQNVQYDRGVGKNVIVRDSFEPLIDFDAEIALSMLATGFNKNRLLEESMIPYVRIGNSPKKLNVELVAKVTRAISERSAIECKYFSATSNNHGTRTLFPTAIFCDGVSWMFRAYHKDPITDSSFKCFDFSRLIAVTELSNIYAGKNEVLESDSDWHMVTPIHLTVHPNLSSKQQAVLKCDFDIEPEANEMVVNTRAVLFYYLVKQWKIDVRNIVPLQSITNSENYYFHLQNRSSLEHLHCMEYVFKNIP
jgi:hypothetical protein